MNQHHYTGNIADSYDATRNTDPVWIGEQNMMTQEIAALAPGQRVLDVGAGTGRYLELLKAKQAVALLTDVSADMLAKAKEKSDRLQYPIKTFIVDVTRSPAFDPADWMISTRLFNWVPHRALRKVLKAALTAGVHHFVFSVRFINADATLKQRLAARFKYFEQNLRVRLGRLDRPIYYLHSERQILSAIKANGLSLTREVVIRHDDGHRYAAFVADKR